MGFTRGAETWAASYLTNALRTALLPKPRHIWLLIADHFEPFWNGADEATARARVKTWSEGWPKVARRHQDSDGAPAKYTFFYPEEEYQPEHIDALASMVRDGIADVEIHLHHDGESADAFVDRMSRFRDVLQRRHGLLHQHDGVVKFAFIHGNWALDNSRADGRYCGLNNELTLLRQLGCYADFTLPSAPSDTQTRTVNRIYWAVDNPLEAKSHDTGLPAVPGGGRRGDLLMVPGPLAIRFAQDGRLRPRLDTGELAGQDPPTRDRVRLWLRHAPRLGEHVFIKLFAHGAQERHSRALLEQHLDTLFTLVAEESRSAGCTFHFASPWQVFLQITSLLGVRDRPIDNRAEVLPECR
jgi:hypothetical protein